MTPKIVLIDSEQATIDDLATAFREFDDVGFAKVDRVIYTAPPKGIDAIFLVLPAAEKWGARPIPGRCQVLKIPPEDQQKGMTPYVVTGVAMRPEDPEGPLPETRQLIITAIEAVREFNVQKAYPINKLGFWAFNLLKGVTAAQLVQVFLEVSEG